MRDFVRGLKDRVRTVRDGYTIRLGGPWRLSVYPRIGGGAQVRVDVSPDDAGLWVQLPLLGAAWLSLNDATTVVSDAVRRLGLTPDQLPWLFETSAHGEKAVSFLASRQVKIGLVDVGDEFCFTWRFWMDPDIWRSTDSQWRAGMVGVADLVLGKMVHEAVDLSEPYSVEVFLPEGMYTVQCVAVRRTWTRPSAKLLRGRFGTVVTRMSAGWECAGDSGIPVPGKHGRDAIYASAVDLADRGTVRLLVGSGDRSALEWARATGAEVAAGVLRSVLHDRYRYGGSQWFVPR